MKKEVSVYVVNVVIGDVFFGLKGPRTSDYFSWLTGNFGRHGYRWCISVPTGNKLAVQFNNPSDAVVFRLAWSENCTT